MSELIDASSIRRAHVSAGALTAALLCVLLGGLAAAPAAAAPWDGPRYLHDRSNALRLHAAPDRFSVTWAPGVERHWAEGVAEPVRPELLDAGGVLLQRVGPLAAPRYHTDEYRVVRDDDGSLAGSPAGSGDGSLGGSGDADDTDGPDDRDGPVDPGAVARALAALPDVAVAGPLFRLFDQPLAPWRAITPRLLLQLHSPADEPAMRALAAELGVLVEGPRGLAANQWALVVPPGATVDPVEAAMALHESTATRWAQVDWLEPREARFTPTDTRFFEQWHLQNTGQEGGVPGNDIGATAAWDLEFGSEDVIVAVLDSGVDADHPEFAGRLLPGYDFISGDDNPDPPGSSHGTGVAGLMAAPAQDIGTVGVCPNCLILPIRMLGVSNEGEADAHDFAVENGAWVINNSWGPIDGTGVYAPIPQVVATAIDHAVTDGRDGLGVAIFWASGNGWPQDTCDLDGYVAYPSTIGVGASTNEGNRSGYSETCPELDLSAPSNGGTAALSTTNIGGWTSSFGGTSGAAPVAAGAGALVLSAVPDLTWDSLRAVLRDSAVKIDPGDAEYDLNGHSELYGYGRVNVLAALETQVAILLSDRTVSACEDELTVTVQIPGSPGLGAVDVTVSSDSEPDGELFTLEEDAPGVYRGDVPLAIVDVVAGDGLVSVQHGETVVISSVDTNADVTVVVDCEGPQISSPMVDALTPWTARLSWTVSEPADGYASWGDSDADSVFDPTHALQIELWAEDLTPCTSYSATLRSTDPLGNGTELGSALGWTTPGDPTELPQGAPDDADPCDPSTWGDGGDDDDDVSDDDDDDTTGDPPLTGSRLTGSGDGCACATGAGSVGAAPGGPGGALLPVLPLVAIGVVGRRRRRR